MRRARRTRRSFGVAVVLSCALFAGCTSGDSRSADSAPPELPELAAARFAATRNSDDAIAFVRSVRHHRDPRFAAHLVDLIRIGYSSTAADEAVAGLAELSGIPATGGYIRDYLVYGQWTFEEAPEPAPGYAEFKAGLYTQVDDEFVPLLLQVTDRRLLGALQWGGVGVGAIRELNDPARIGPAAAGWAQSDEVLFGTVGTNGTPLAYPERIIGRHELANDVLDGVPIAVSYCTLCRASRAFDRRIDGRTLTFRTSGLLLYSNKVMVDNETSSLWQQLTGEAIAGPLTGKRLQELPVETTTWADWTARHPDTVVVDRPPPLAIDPETGTPLSYDYRPDAALASYFASEELWFPVLATPDHFPLKEPVATLALGGRHLAVSVAALAAAGEVVVRVGDRSVRVVAIDRGARFSDATTGQELVSGQAFWFAWYGLHPDTDWWPMASG